jgi:hypothetical protein
MKEIYRLHLNFEECFGFKINFEETPPIIEGMLGMPIIPEYWTLNRCMIHGQTRDKVRKVEGSQI